MKRTRELILDALIAQLADTGPFEYSMFEVARRAGVSVRTVYRHFADREALFAALAERVSERVGSGGQAESQVESLTELPQQLFARFEAEAALVRAQLSTSLDTHERAGQVERLARAIDERLPDLDAGTRARALAIFSSLLSAGVWSRMKSELGLAGEESGRAVSWALRVLLDALDQEQRQASVAS